MTTDSFDLTEAEWMPPAPRDVFAYLDDGRPPLSPLSALVAAAMRLVHESAKVADSFRDLAAAAAEPPLVWLDEVHAWRSPVSPRLGVSPGLLAAVREQARRAPLAGYRFRTPGEAR